jgi:hypothetical protein
MLVIEHTRSPCFTCVKAVGLKKIEDLSEKVSEREREEGGGGWKEGR